MPYTYRCSQLLLGLALSLFACQSVPETKSSPNIILILTDDQGHGDIGYHGNPLIHTPVLDSLAENSVRFTNFYVSPVCAPTRASLMSGRYSLETGVYDTYTGGSIMAAEIETLAERLKANGYRTGIFGKWHLGDNYPFRPQDQGFDETLIHTGGGLEQPGDFYENFIRKGHSYFDPYLLENGRKVQKEGFCSDIFTEAAMEFVGEKKEAPFFLYLAYNAPHTPLEAPQRFLSRYADMVYSLDTFAIQGNEEVRQRFSPKDLEAAKKVYAMVSNIDENLGKLFSQLRTQGIDEETLIIFMTDNGPQQIRYKSGLYGRKGSVYEGGVKVPSFWHYPKGFGESRDQAQLTAHIDVMPTLMSMIGAPSPAAVDGQSLLPLLTRKDAKFERKEPLYFHWMRGFPHSFHNMAVRTDSFKLTSAYYFQESPKDFQLFDMRQDPFEQNDLKAQYPDAVQALATQYQDWLRARKASPYLQTAPAISLTAPDQDTIHLGRNDWKGTHAKSWSSIEGVGYWDVEVREAGEYFIELFFQDSLPGHGFMRTRIGTEEAFRKVKDQSQRTQTFSLTLQPGKFRLEAWLECNWPQKGSYGPYHVRVAKR